MARIGNFPAIEKLITILGCERFVSCQDSTKAVTRNVRGLNFQALASR